MKCLLAKFFLLVFVSLMVLAACSKKEEKDVFLLVLKTIDNPFFVSIEDGARSVLEERDKTELIVRAGANESDVDTQRNILQSYYDEYVTISSHLKLKGILLTPSSSGPELIPVIKKYRERGIPVIVIDTKLSSKELKASETDISAFVGSSNYKGGMLAAELILSHFNNITNVLILNGVEGQETATSRRAGFTDYLKSNIAGRAISTEERTCNWRREEARSVVSALWGFGKTYNAIFAANDEMALGAVSALSRFSEKPIIVGFDAIDEARVAVLNGEMFATLAQDSFAMGEKAVETLFKVINNESVEQHIEIDVIPVTKN
jgi:ribose transport system substrate-binding protein